MCLQTYGFPHLLTFHHLHAAHLLAKPEHSSTSTLPRILTSTSSSPTSPAISSLRKPLRLIVDDVDDNDPRDMSYVFSGYAPVSVRLVQVAVTGSVGVTSGLAKDTTVTNPG